MFSMLALSVGPLAQTGMSTGRGIVTDRDGNPVEGAVVSFAPKSSPDRIYTGKSNKKGKYNVDGMFTGVERDLWLVWIEVEGLIAVEVTVELRTGNNVLTGDITTIKLKPGQKPQLPIRPLGSAKINWVVAPPGEVAQAAPAGTTPGAQKPAPAAPKRDPWAAALQAASDGDLIDSVELFEKAIKDEPESAERRRAFAQVLYQMQDLTRAEAEANKAVELDPNAVESHLVLYSVAVAAGDMAKASTALGAAQGIDPNNADLLRQMAFVARETGDAAGELAAYEQIVAANPEDVEAWLSLGDLYAKSGDSEKSRQAYERVTELDPTNAHQIFFNLGALQTNAGNTEKAVVAYRKAIEIKPDYALAHKELAFALVGMGNRSEAAEHLNQYVELAPDAPDAAQMQALVKSLQQ
jgi:tetratricopeptide (TPR) repeat protein